MTGHTVTPTERLFASVAARGPAAIALVTRAHVVASEAHHGQLRRSGDPYITHPVAVAAIVAELGADLTTVVAALLHDVPDGTDYPVERLQDEFGDPVSDVLATFGAINRSRTFEDLAGTDPRAVLVRVVERLHNMQTIRYLEKSAQQRKALQTRRLVAPLARTLGLPAVATELDALANRTLDAGATGPSPALPTGGVRAARGVLHALTRALLPVPSRDRWLTEWDGELHALPGQRDRLLFIADVLLALPALAVRSRHPDDGGEP
jgi:hypothetical protein